MAKISSESRRASARNLSCGAMFVIGSVLLMSSVAAAAGAGYEGTPVTLRGLGASIPVTTVAPLCTSGKTITAVVAGVKLKIVVPAGDFKCGEQLVVGNAANVKAVKNTKRIVAFDIAIYKNGTPKTAAFGHALKIIVTSPKVSTGDKVYQSFGNVWGLANSYVITSGKATINFGAPHLIEVAKS
jgi:hypothetical protein